MSENKAKTAGLTWRVAKEMVQLDQDKRRAEGKAFSGARADTFGPWALTRRDYYPKTPMNLDVSRLFTAIEKREVSEENASEAYKYAKTVVQAAAVRADFVRARRM